MKLNVISVCSQCTAEELLSAAPRARAQSDFLKLEWQQGENVRDLDGFLDVLQRSVNENLITVILDGSEGYYTKSMIAEGLDLELEEDADCRKALETYCQLRGLSLTGRMLEGIRIPAGAQPFCSSETVDQGFILVRGGRCIAVFPATKKSFEEMFTKGFYPFLLHHGAETAVVQTMAIRPSKVKDVEEYLRLFRCGKNILPLVYEEMGEYYLSITAIRATEMESRQACNSLVENIREEMGDFILTPSTARKDSRQARKEKKKSRALREIEEYNPEESSRNPRKKKEGMGFFRKFLIFICLCTFAVSAGYLGLRAYRSISNQQGYDDLKNLYGENTSLPSDYPSDYDPYFADLYQINKDVVGWLKIEGTSLDYPVVQTTNNDYYHRLNFEGQSNLHGVPYVDYTVDLKEPSNNTIIYGHNIKNDDQMFNSLIKYWKPEHYKEHPIVEFHTVYGKRQYKIFAAFVANVKPEHGEVFQYHTFVDADSVADMQEFLYNVQVRSILNTGVDVQPSDELLTLSTCTYEFDDARFVIVARRLRDGESPEIDGSKVSKNSEALMPDIWYELYGGSKPVLSVPTFSDTVVLDKTEPDFAPPVEQPKEEAPAVIPETPVPETSVPEVTPPPVTEAPSQTTTPPPAETPTPSETIVMPNPQPQPQPPAPETETPAPETQTPVPETPPVTEPPKQEEELPSEMEKVEEDDSPPAWGNYVPPKTETPKEEEKAPEKEPAKEPEKQPEKEPEPAPQPESKPETQPEQTPTPPEEEEKDDKGETLSVRYNGKKVSGTAFDIVSMMVQAEMGSSFEQEALKAQAVAAYTYVKYNNASGIAPSIAGKTTVSSNVAKAVKAVLGEAVYYKGSYANTTYCAANAGVSNNCVDVWGGNLPYLVSVESEGDENTVHYGYQSKLSLEYVAERIEDYHNVDPFDYSDDPSDWFGKMTYGAGKYVDSVKLCGSSIKGRLVREGLLQSKIRSAAFEVEYDEDSETFIFTTYGYGHGVGMSQLGANYYAKQGWSYVDILEHYYSGTTVK